MAKASKDFKNMESMEDISKAFEQNVKPRGIQIVSRGKKEEKKVVKENEELWGDVNKVPSGGSFKPRPKNNLGNKKPIVKPTNNTVKNLFHFVSHAANINGLFKIFKREGACDLPTYVRLHTLKGKTIAENRYYLIDVNFAFNGNTGGDLGIEIQSMLDNYIESIISYDDTNVRFIFKDKTSVVCERFMSMKFFNGVVKNTILFNDNLEENKKK